MKLAIKSVLACAAVLAAGICSAQGTWQAATNNGSNNSTASGACYMVTFNADSHGTRFLVGNGVVSGDYFTGFLWFPGVTNRGRTDCGTGAVGQCAWSHAYSGVNGNLYSVAVSALPILSAQPTGCY